MGYNSLCVLLLLSSYSAAQGGRETPSCQLASRFKAHKKYVYQYVTESLNGVVGTANLRNGPKVSCQVEIEVPQVCRFIMQTRDCTVSEVSVMDPQGQPVFGPAPGSDAFRTSMEKNPLKFSVDSDTHVEVYPEADEPVNILNIKRGIVSAFMLPLMEGERSSSVSTVHGRCLTEYVVNSRQEFPTDVTVSRDLSQCDQFYSRTLTNSPLALVQQLHNPVSKLITGSQSCSYQFDHQGAHIITATCSERHKYLPLSHQENGISSIVTQDLSFQSVRRSSSRDFDAEHHQAKPLHFEDPDDKTPIQTKEAVLNILQELVTLAGSNQGQKRSSLFHQLISSMRVLRNETLSQTVADMVGVSSWITFQALIQCGTPECTSAIMQIIWTINGVGLEVDALVYGLSLQASPDAARVRDMLSMAQYKQSKAIMFALGNTVKKFHQTEVTPEVTEVSKFMEMLLNDCSEEVQDADSDVPPDPKEVAFLVLKVVGVMGRAMQDVSPTLISSVLNCVKKKDAPLSNQKAAVQALRLMDVNEEIRNALIEVYQDPQSPVEKRLAAYLVLMKNPDQTFIRDVLKDLMDETEEQIKGFVVSHLKNLHDSYDQTPELKEVIQSVLQDHLTPRNQVFDGLSQNYRAASGLGSIQSNIIFDDSNTMPKEMMLEASLKAFDLDYNIFEVGVEGTGFQPSTDALFGDKGFFPESISRLVDLAGDSAPIFRDFLRRLSPRGDRMRRQASEDHLKSIRDIFQKLLNDVRFSPAPEATAYLRLLGDEIGYLKTSEMRKMLETLVMYQHIFFRILPEKAFFKLTSQTENEVFFHYVFMESVFCLPTASGFPLRFSLSGVFAPGAKGGLTPSAMTDLSFMPSVGLEFITQMGVHIPDYVDSGIEMHTNIYHESSLNAKVTVSRNQVKLSVPAPKSSTQLFSISNKLLSVSSGQTKMVPSLVEDRVDSTRCRPLLPGLNLCTAVRYSNATSVREAPFYPLTGETRFAVEIQPTGKVSEFSATITDETLREGKKGRQRVVSLKLTLKAEGEEPMEATASVKYNRNKNLISSEVRIPDYDVEAGVNVAVTDSDHNGKKMRGITISVTNKNIPQLTVVGRARHDGMREAVLQLQVEVPPLKTDASITAVLEKDENTLIGLETVVHLPEASYQQTASLKLDDEKFEVELKTDLNVDVKEMLPNAEEHRRTLQNIIDEVLDQRVTKTDMKLRHIVTKGIEAGNIWLDRLTTRFPSLAGLRGKRSISDLKLPPLPEGLFLQTDSLFRYQFNKEKMFFSLLLPLGGRTSEELNLPKSLSLPAVDLSPIGFYIPANKVVLPSFTVPASLDVSLPLLGLFEASANIHSSFYSWEGSISGGNDTVDVPNYVVQYKAVAQGPVCLLSYEVRGVGMISGTADDHVKYLLNSSVSHCLMDSSFSVSETFRVTNKVNARAAYKIQASSPLGLQAFLFYSAQSTSTLDSDEVLGDGAVDGRLKLGSSVTNASYSHSYSLRPLDREGRGESAFHFHSPFIRFQNAIQGLYSNSELNILSRTSSEQNDFKHVAELKYKDAQLTLKCNAVGLAVGRSLNNQVELGVSSRMSVLRIESQVDDDASRMFSLITGSLDSNGLEVNSEGSLISGVARGLHKASVMIGKDGVVFGGVNSVQCSPVTLENNFNGAVDLNGASVFSATKVTSDEGRGEVKVHGKVTASEASLDGDFKGHAHDASTANSVSLKLNRQALTLTGDSRGTLGQIQTENLHSLTVTLWTFSLRSKTHDLLCEDIYYKQNTRVDGRPFVLIGHVTNDLRFHDLSLNNEVRLKLEPVQVDLSGAVRGAYREDHNIKHTYQLSYKDLSASVKLSTSGTTTDVQLSHSCELESAGLSLTSKCEARLSSEHLHFDGTIRSVALPFSLSVDASVHSDGGVNLHGKHSGELFTKILLRAAPLALACSCDSRASSRHELQNGEFSTSLANKFEGLLIPNDQSLDWKVTSKLNDHAYEQVVSAYNDPEKVGVEFSGGVQTDILSRFKRSRPETQKFGVSGFMKYDKKSDCHVVQIPLIESFPAAFENLKNVAVQALESLQQLIRSLQINQLIADLRADLDRLPMHVKNFLRRLDLENQVNRIKGKLDYLVHEFAVRMEDLELTTSSLKLHLETSIMGVLREVQSFISTLEEFIEGGHFRARVESLLSQVGDQLQAFDEKYKLKQLLIKVLDVMEDIIRQVDLQKVRESSAAFLQSLDSRYGIMETIKDKLSELKLFVQDFSLTDLLDDVKNRLLSVDWTSYVQQFSYEVPAAEIQRVMESMNEVINNWIDEYEIPNKLNAVHSFFKDVLLKYDLDGIFKDLMDQAVVLVKRWRIEDTVQSLVEALKSIQFEVIHDKVLELLYGATNKLREIDFKESVDEFNRRVSSILRSVEEFDYQAFVDETNVKIAELTDYLNEEIEKLEFVKKIEAMRQFFKEIQSSVYTYLEELRNTKVADALKRLKELVDSAFYDDVKLKVQDVLEDMRQRIADMDIRDEIYLYLQRASESYRNTVAFFSAQINELMEWIVKASDEKVFKQMKRAVDGGFDQLKKAAIDVPTFTVPLTDLVIPGFTISLNKLQDINIPAQISVPKVTILGSYTLPAFTVDFDQMKAKIVAFIDYIRGLEVQTPDPEDVFADLKVLYLFDLPDLTFPEVILSEIKVPVINIPKLSLEDFEITVLTIPDMKFPELPSDVCVPVFGKLHGGFSVHSPQLALVTTAKIENSTSTLRTPQFTATVTSQARSSFEVLEHRVEATARVEAPRMKKLQVTETLKVNHVAFSVDHEGSLTLTGSSAEASAKTTSKATTQVYTADLINTMAFSLKSGIYALIDTSYNHTFNIPSAGTSSQASAKQSVAARLESGAVTVTGETSANGKWSLQGFSDEGIHKSNAELRVDFSSARLRFVGETDCKTLKSKQTLTAESVVLSHVTVEAKCETEAPSVKKSIIAFNGEAHVGDLKASLTASHDAEFTGGLTGTTSSSFEFLARPFDVSISVKNKLNSKTLLPLKLTGKVDLQHDCDVVLNSEKQRVCWFALARFNQYRYSHTFTAENNERDVHLHSSAEGEANLDFLTVPLSIPQMTVPYLRVQTPELRDFSLWEDGGLKFLLFNPQQSFDMDLKLQYHKNSDIHTFELHLEPIYDAIGDNAKRLQAQFEAYRDKVVTLLKDSYNEAKSQYIKHKVDTSSLPPRIFRVPGYRIPVVNIQVSAFSAEMPAFSYFIPKEVRTPSFRIPALGFSVPSYILVLPSLRFPVIHVPESLSEIKPPAFSLPAVQDSIGIPAMGNITYDFSFKSAVVTLNAHAGLYNQSDVVVRFGASSASVFDVLNVKIDGTTSVTRTRGLKLASSVSLEHSNMEANHECSVSLTKRSTEASVANAAKINLPFLQLEFNQELTGNTRTKPSVSSKKNLQFLFNIPQIPSVGKGSFEMNWELEAPSSYVSLDTFIHGKSDVLMMDSWSLVGDLEHKKGFVITANGLGTNAATALKFKVDKQETQKRSLPTNLLSFDLSSISALELFLQHVFATVNYTSSNSVNFDSFDTRGENVFKGELDLVPLRSFRMSLNTDVSQLSSLGDLGLVQSADLTISSEKQSLTWSGKEQLPSFTHAHDFIVFNDESEAGVKLTGSVEGHLAFLKAVRLPVYQRTLWDVLRFDEVTNTDNMQFLNISSSVIYTKSLDGWDYQIPLKLLENGVTFSIPQISIPVPSWVKKIPQSIKNSDMRFESVEIPDQLVFPPEIPVPAFDVPFTNLHVEPFTIDPKNLIIPKQITVEAFELVFPGLPVLTLPSYHIDSEYQRNKSSFLSFRFPQNEMTLSSFTIPKSLSIGAYTVSLDDVAGQISDFQLPTVVIPKQKLQIPEISLHVPSSVFIPTFGSFGVSLNVSSSIHNVSTSALVKKEESNLLTSLSSSCSSTVGFLEYDLNAGAAVSFNNGLIHLNGMSRLVHGDVTVDWQHVLSHPLRTKRQISRGDSVMKESRHTLNVDVTSRTFADVNFRFASRKDGITASVSSPSAGFLGLHLQRRSPSQLQGKLFSRYLSSPEKDTNVFTAKASLRNADKLVLQTSWNGDFINDASEGLQDRIPTMTEAVLKFVNKHHASHFGFDVKRGFVKLKNAASNLIEMVFHHVEASVTRLQDLIQDSADQGRNIYMRLSDGLMSISVPDVKDAMVLKVKAILHQVQIRTEDLLESIPRFFKNIKFRFSGSERKFSIKEMFWEAHQSVSQSFNTALQQLFRLLGTISDHIRSVEFTLPGTEVVLNGNEMMDSLTSEAKAASHHFHVYLNQQLDWLHATLNGTETIDGLIAETAAASHHLKYYLSQQFSWLSEVCEHVLQMIAEKAERLLAYVKDENREVMSRVDAVYAEILQSSKQHEAQKHAAEYKDAVKLKIHEAYGALKMERINSGAKEFLSVLQSNLSEALSESVDLMRAASQSTAPYIRVGKDKVDVEIHLPFLWKSFSDWPTQIKH